MAAIPFPAWDGRRRLMPAVFPRNVREKTWNDHGDDGGWEKLAGILTDGICGRLMEHHAERRLAMRGGLHGEVAANDSYQGASERGAEILMEEAERVTSVVVVRCRARKWLASCTCTIFGRWNLI